MENQNFFTLNRKAQTPQQSINSLTQYAIQADARHRFRRGNLNKASWIVTAIVFAPPFLYGFYGALFGPVQSLSPNFSLMNSFIQFSQGFRAVYRPEIMLRENAEELYRKEKEILKNKDLAANSPLVLWH